MGRVKEVRALVEARLLRLDTETQVRALRHLHGVALASALLAKKRSLPADLAQIAALLHDLAAFESGSYDDHAKNGATLAKRVLTEYGKLSLEESETVCQAILHHDDKDVQHTPFDELLKDADVFDHSLSDVEKAIKEKEAPRFAALMVELGVESLTA